MFAFSLATGPAGQNKALGLNDLLVQSADASAVDYYLQIDGIDGESTTAGHENQIDIESYSFGEHNSGSTSFGGGSGAGKVQMDDFNFTMRVNKASVALFLATANGKHIKDATLMVVRSAGKDKGQVFLTWKFSDVLVSSYRQNAGGSDLLPLDSFSLSFGKIEVEYRQQKPDGTLGEPIKAGWDLKENKGV
ncbi:MAG: type VI secretion system tube protein Hcp [Candidatus Doudnabacteria bacterium]|nr:type VI secretion system tube protein Hcp [Candidatus Doudnabacteria bacterium]